MAQNGRTKTMNQRRNLRFHKQRPPPNKRTREKWDNEEEEDKKKTGEKNAALQISPIFFCTQQLRMMMCFFLFLHLFASLFFFSLWYLGYVKVMQLNSFHRKKEVVQFTALFVKAP